MRKLFAFVSKQTGTFFHWLALLFADDDDNRNPNAPAMKNVVFFMMVTAFLIGFLKVVYLQEVVIRHDLRGRVVFKSNVDTTQTVQQPQAQDNDDQPQVTIQIPDIPTNFRDVFLYGLGILAGLSGVKGVATAKYGGGSNGNGGTPTPPTTPIP